MRTTDFEYLLPSELIAQRARPRGTSRLLVVRRGEREGDMRRITALPGFLQPHDVLLLNDVRVIPARLRVRRPGGGAGELLLVRPLGGGAWEVLARPSKRLRAGITLMVVANTARESPGSQESLESPKSAESAVLAPIEAEVGEGRWRVRFEPPLDEAVLAAVGEAPLPPYIRRERGATGEDRRRYQTVYARGGRAVAAPTAGLHFTPELLAAVADRGVEVLSLTLHVGPGTFRPVQAEDPREHRLDAEEYEIAPAVAGRLNRALAAGRRIVCVGTTSCRALEHALAAGSGRVRAGRASADLLILPGFRFRGTGALLTNFHLPRSSLLMLVAAFAGRERVLGAYRVAVAAGFRFYSYGDAMLIQ